MLNQDLFDEAIRQQVKLQRFTAGEVKRIAKVLEQSDLALVRLLRRRSLTRGTNRLLREIKELRAEVLKTIEKELKPTLRTLATKEAKKETELLFPLLTTALLAKSVVSETFQGNTLGQWFRSSRIADNSRIRTSIQLGLAQDESKDAIIQAVVGTRGNRFSDGVLARSRRNIEAVVRTSINHTSNAARERVWERNSDKIQAIRWTAILDGLTTAICRGRDGKFAPVGNKPLPSRLPALDPPGARPPAHVGCRSMMIAFLVDGGPVEDETYNEFLKKQSTAFQNEVLGIKKAQLFRKGSSVDKFVDRNGNELTLDEL